MSDTSREFRVIPTLTGTPPSELDVDDLPATPKELWSTWLEEALDAQVPEPIAATLATVDADGTPDARTLVLKGVDERGWAFASTASSRKGVQLADRPAAALELYWQPIARAVRARGPVELASPEEWEADLAARSPEARATVPPGQWRLWRLRPERVEFWQGSTDRRHLRIVYTRDAEGWHVEASRAAG
ncbi:pyridoxine/pyridoxamine 5'-phosphate oxidase [Mobilicoccus massiliensis]|uniref:pyridoxine/pyridoxamine 5'-phosphate oxidase n=1 Tax=Mobilicoccus massiliensis TaxID=1522310 RepID=UPI00058C0C34|nr:pyridoxamine 5'-phosphate oxidase family protein [Mobilicoccus massiliensis]